MSDSGNQGAASLFTLVGPVKVHLVDGQILEGNIAAQDAFNIFISVSGAPTMIPRIQISYLQGQPGQPVVVDSWAAQLEPWEPQPAVPAEPAPEVAAEIPEVAPPVAVEEAPAPRERQTTDEAINAVFTSPAVEPVFKPTLEPASPVLLDSDEGTVVLEPGALSLKEETKGAPAEEGTVDIDFDAGLEEDRTFVLAAPDDSESTDIFTPVTRAEESDTTVVVPLTGREVEVTATLSVTSGPHNGDKFTLRSGITTVGRSSDNVIVLSKDKEISRHHAIIVHESGQYVVQDQNSLNGTFVNEEQISGPHYLKDGDKILVGLSTLMYSLG
jgi:sRNA-binding regulator protein Hfq